ncbi:MAG: nuclear transport factor 2 family protein [Hyphomonadaceae bacterium]|nr:nuclear transport factor 2 family protein [Hyphomonadaceae bacterium]
MSILIGGGGMSHRNGRGGAGEQTESAEGGASEQMSRRRLVTASVLAGASASAGAALAPCAAEAQPRRRERVEDRVAELEAHVATLERQVARAHARGAVENVWSRYQYLHTAFRDAEIITDLWVKPGTPSISAQYTNTGVYNTWDSVMAYHRNRPSPVGKLLVHFTTSPLIEVAEDGETAKGVWIIAGVESGMSEPEVAARAPANFFEPGLVEGKKVWAHWVQCRYALDFLKQDGEWRIWHFRCVEISRAPFSKNWIAFASEMQANQRTSQFHNDLAYFGDDGRPVFMPPVDGPPKSIAHSYRTDRAFAIEPPLPRPYRTFSETFDY